MGVWSRLREHHPDVKVLFVVGEPAIAAEACEEAPADVQVLVDRAFVTARRYNAFWRPRAYAIDGSGRLAYVQPPEATETQALMDVAALWKREG
jgi:hypothetical protein